MTPSYQISGKEVKRRYERSACFKLKLDFAVDRNRLNEDTSKTRGKGHIV